VLFRSNYRDRKTRWPLDARKWSPQRWRVERQSSRGHRVKKSPRERGRRQHLHREQPEPPRIPRWCDDPRQSPRPKQRRPEPVHWSLDGVATQCSPNRSTTETSPVSHVDSDHRHREVPRRWSPSRDETTATATQRSPTGISYQLNSKILIAHEVSAYERRVPKLSRRVRCSSLTPRVSTGSGN
jgi:hypothetical protein